MVLFLIFNNCLGVNVSAIQHFCILAFAIFISRFWNSTFGADFNNQPFIAVLMFSYLRGQGIEFSFIYLFFFGGYTDLLELSTNHFYALVV